MGCMGTRFCVMMRGTKRITSGDKILWKYKFHRYYFPPRCTHNGLKPRKYSCDRVAIWGSIQDFNRPLASWNLDANLPHEMLLLSITVQLPSRGNGIGISWGEYACDNPQASYQNQCILCQKYMFHLKTIVLNHKYFRHFHRTDTIMFNVIHAIKGSKFHLSIVCSLYEELTLKRALLRLNRL